MTRPLWLLYWTCRDCGTQVPPPIPNGCPTCKSQDLELEGKQQVNGD